MIDISPEVQKEIDEHVEQLNNGSLFDIESIEAEAKGKTLFQDGPDLEVDKFPLLVALKHYLEDHCYTIIHERLTVHYQREFYKDPEYFRIYGYIKAAKGNGYFLYGIETRYSNLNRPIGPQTLQDVILDLIESPDIKQDRLICNIEPILMGKGQKKEARAWAEKLIIEHAAVLEDDTPVCVPYYSRKGRGGWGAVTNHTWDSKKSLAAEKKLNEKMKREGPARRKIKKQLLEMSTVLKVRMSKYEPHYVIFSDGTKDLSNEIKSLGLTIEESYRDPFCLPMYAMGKGYKDDNIYCCNYNPSEADK